MRRREFMALLGSAAAWPLAARAQQPRAIGYLSSVSEAETRHILASFRRGLLLSLEAAQRAKLSAGQRVDGGHTVLQPMDMQPAMRQIDLLPS